MNPWLFVITAYAVAIAFTLALLLWACSSMLRAEAAAEKLKVP